MTPAYSIGHVEPRFPSAAAEAEFSQTANRHLARQVRWVLNIDGADRFDLILREETDVRMLIDSWREGPGKMQAVVGREVEAGVIAFDQIQSFTRPRSAVFDRLVQTAAHATSCAGARVLHYCAARDLGLSAKDAECAAIGFVLENVTVEPCTMARSRAIFTVTFRFTNPETDASRTFFLRVDATEEFPFLVTPLTPYYPN